MEATVDVANGWPRRVEPRTAVEREQERAASAALRAKVTRSGTELSTSVADLLHVLSQQGDEVDAVEQVFVTHQRRKTDHR